MAAQSPHHSKSARGDFYRRIPRKAGRTEGHYSGGPQIGRHHFSLGDYASGIR
jgi:hypothetical protein